MNITGNTRFIAHLGYPTHSFKAPLIYNPYFEAQGIDCVVIPMACRADQMEAVLKGIMPLDNFVGALITMPLKTTVLGQLDVIHPAAAIAGACNAVKRNANGEWEGDMFDGQGFVRGLINKGFEVRGSRVMVIGSGGVGSAIAAALAQAGATQMSLFDTRAEASLALAKRLSAHFPQLEIQAQACDPTGHQLVVNATPMGMNPGDPLPIDVALLTPDMFVGEVVMRAETTAFLSHAIDKGCQVQVGVDMLFEQIPAYLEFFGLPSTTAARLRELARIAYPKTEVTPA